MFSASFAGLGLGYIGVEGFNQRGPEAFQGLGPDFGGEGGGVGDGED